MSTPTHDRHIADLERDIAALTSELAEARAERDSLAETRAALTANLNALTVDVATMRAERDEARRALAEMWSAAWLLMWRAIGDSISADDWCNEWARCPSPEAFAEVTRERDALKACRHVGPWIEDRGTWRRVRTIGEAGAVYHAGWITQTMDGKAWNVASDGLVLARRVALDAAKAAADAHLLAAGWWLEGGAHGAGEAK